jgi:RimJ/RimL family protein N-acetyltransferase
MTTPDSSIRVRALSPSDAPAVVALRKVALADTPLAFAASAEDDRAADVDFVRGSLADIDNSAIYGAFDGDDLVAMAGIVRQRMLKLRHKTLVWGMYVAACARGRGVGEELIDAVIDHARSWPGVSAVQLAASETAAAAQRLYERKGFRRWGIEPEALAWEGRLYAEHHYALQLTR